MNKTSIKNYAIWARNELISRVSQRAFEYGVEKDNTLPYDIQSIKGRLLSEDEKKKRQILLGEVKRKGYDQVIEEVAYTWFNRFIALRFMEVNNYLPNKVRLFTNENNEFKPQIIDEALHVDLPGLDMKQVIALKESNNNEELYKELLLATCNDMSQYLPGMFKPISDYMTLLFPSNLLREESVLGRLISDIEEDSWTDQVQIIGWLYQYYISEKHDEVIDPLHGKTIKKEDIPAATQLFTTDWVVKYILDNSLGRYWVERNKDSSLINKLKYYCSSSNASAITDEKLSPLDIKIIDPCVGSGHFLSYAFDILLEIYRECGWSDRDAAQSIIENNIYGLDIDDRAIQLAYFSIMMKARKHNRRILQHKEITNIVVVEESDNLSDDLIEYVAHNNDAISRDLHRIKNLFINAKEYGSIICMPELDYESLFDYVKGVESQYASNLIELQYQQEISNVLLPLLNQAKILAKRYEVVVTNPPYFNKYSEQLKSYITTHFSAYKSDLFSVFISRNFGLCKENGYSGFMTPMVWMFIRSYDELRSMILNHKSIVTLIQFEYSAFEEATVPICSFVLRNGPETEDGCYFKLSDFRGGMDVQRSKVEAALLNKDCGYYYETSLSELKKIPGTPIAYWMSHNAIDNFSKMDSIGDYGAGRIGLITGDANRFLRLWSEVDYSRIGFGIHSNEESIRSQKRWFPSQKGGDFRKWYGNQDYVVNWENDGYEMKFDNYMGKRVRSHNYNGDFAFKKAITWTTISSSNFACRFSPDGFIYDTAGPFININNDANIYSILALMNSCVADYYLKILNPTINFPPGYIQAIPFDDKCNNETIRFLGESCVEISKNDWDSFETSWNFKRHPLIKGGTKISESYEVWKKECTDQFRRLKTNEEELNKLFIDIYGLQNELAFEVEEKDVTVRKADLQREIKSLISYAVGCMFGRYSLDVDGLAYAGGKWDDSKYESYIPDKDNIIPICDDEYFNDDITGKFIEFIKIAYGEDTLEENLRFIADSLGGKGASREVIRNYFINDFYKDHCNTYQVTGSGKRPIYWQFDSGKKNGFKALVYIHRYTPDLIARMRTSYVHEQQSRYENQIAMVQNRIDSAASTSERVKAEKELKKLKDQADELRVYEEKIHHWADKMEPMDLDDGVKANCRTSRYFQLSE